MCLVYSACELLGVVMPATLLVDAKGMTPDDNSTTDTVAQCMEDHLPLSAAQLEKSTTQRRMPPTQLRHLFVTHLEQMACGYNTEHRAAALAAQEAIAAMQLHQGSAPAPDQVARAAVALQSVQVRRQVYNGTAADFTAAMRANFVAYFGNMCEGASFKDPDFTVKLETAAQLRARVIQEARCDTHDSEPDDYDDFSGESSQAELPPASSGVMASLHARVALRAARPKAGARAISLRDYVRVRTGFCIATSRCFMRYNVQRACL